MVFVEDCLSLANSVFSHDDCVDVFKTGCAVKSDSLSMSIQIGPIDDDFVRRTAPFGGDSYFSGDGGRLQD